MHNCDFHDYCSNLPVYFLSTKPIADLVLQGLNGVVRTYVGCAVWPPSGTHQIAADQPQLSRSRITIVDRLCGILIYLVRNSLFTSMF
jgi:hypothetical protein